MKLFGVHFDNLGSVNKKTIHTKKIRTKLKTLFSGINFLFSVHSHFHVLKF